MIKVNNDSFFELEQTSNSLNSILEDLASSKKCAISKYIYDLRRIPHKNRMYFMCDILTSISFKCIDNEIAFTFLPKSKIAGLNSKSAEEIRSLRQQGSPAKVAMTLINDKRPTEKVSTVSVNVNVVNNDMSITTKKKAFWFDEEYGIAYNDSENLFELADEENTATLKSGNKQFFLFKKDDFEKFANYVKNNFLCNFEFKVLSGPDIAKYYHHNNYYSAKGQKGSLWGSCMKSNSPSTFKYYTENPETIGMVTAFYEGKVLGRALLWNTTDGPVMDRIYSYEDYILQSFIDYAESNHISYKKYYTNAGHEQDWMVYNKETKIYERKTNYPIEILIKKPFQLFSEHPYKDTFYCSTGKSYKQLDNMGVLTNFKYCDSDGNNSSGDSTRVPSRSIPLCLTDLQYV